MADDFTETIRMAAVTARAFNAEYCQRVRALREARGFSQEQMADALGIPADRYRKYEGRSPLPAYLIPRFALIVGRDIEFVVTGRPARRTAAPLPVAPVRRPGRPSSD